MNVDEPKPGAPDASNDDKTPTGPHHRRRRTRVGRRTRRRTTFSVPRFRWWHLPLVILVCVAAVKLTIVLLTPGPAPPPSGGP